MIQRGRGRIINICSGAGFEAWPLASAYAVSKAALFRLSENLAVETREQGVQVFAIDPGLVHTDMVEGILHCGEPSIEQAVTEWLAAGGDIPPERAAQMVVFLASGRGDALSGRFLLPTDDEEALVGRAGELAISEQGVRDQCADPSHADSSRRRGHRIHHRQASKLVARAEDGNLVAESQHRRPPRPTATMGLGRGRRSLVEQSSRVTIAPSWTRHS
jgi:hypothetical protein